MIRGIDNYYLNQEEPVKSCLHALQSTVPEQDTIINETQKYGMPCLGYKKRYSVICEPIKKRMSLIFGNVNLQSLPALLFLICPNQH